MTTPVEPRTNTLHPATVAQDDQAVRESTLVAAPDEQTHTDTGLQRANSNRNSASSRILGMTGPAGEPGLPPSRPSSIATAQSGGNSRRWSQAPPSGRGGAFSGIGPGSVTGSLSAQSRPTTSASRTHVPLAAHGFFRPMSSQRLQQQRNQRPTSLLGHSSLYTEGTAEFGGSSYRQSIGSNNTIKGQHPLGLHHDLDQPPPPSRGTDITDRDLPDRTTANTTPTGAETVRSRGESITPLQRPKPQHLDLSKSLKADSGTLPTPGKSPRSFKSGFMLPSRDGRSTQMRPQTGHEKLASAESSPRMTRKSATKEVVKQELGRNHQYFSGNTAFCWGGRLQNTRDRPVNIATALIIGLPAGLFLGFSYVSVSVCNVDRVLIYSVRHGYGITFLLRYPLSLRTFFWSACLPSFTRPLRTRGYVSPVVSLDLSSWF
jgi:palmitoyltransferase ZDHHC9/14/18